MFYNVFSTHQKKRCWMFNLLRYQIESFGAFHSAEWGEKKAKMIHFGKTFFRSLNSIEYKNLINFCFISKCKIVLFAGVLFNMFYRTCSRIKSQMLLLHYCCCCLLLTNSTHTVYNRTWKKENRKAGMSGETAAKMWVYDSAIAKIKYKSIFPFQMDFNWGNMCTFITWNPFPKLIK